MIPPARAALWVGVIHPCILHQKPGALGNPLGKGGGVIPRELIQHGPAEDILIGTADYHPHVVAL